VLSFIFFSPPPIRVTTDNQGVGSCVLSPSVLLVLRFPSSAPFRLLLPFGQIDLRSLLVFVEIDFSPLSLTPVPTDSRRVYLNRAPRPERRTFLRITNPTSSFESKEVLFRSGNIQTPRLAPSAPPKSRTGTFPAFFFMVCFAAKY